MSGQLPRNEGDGLSRQLPRNEGGGLSRQPPTIGGGDLSRELQRNGRGGLDRELQRSGRGGLGRHLQKYLAVAGITLRSAWAYLWDRLFSTLFLVIIIFVFVQLWKATFATQGAGARIDGYTLPEMIWYLVATEAIILSLPRVHAVLEQEVKDGDLALRLNKPYSYLGFHYASFLGEALLSLVSLLLVGGGTAYLLVGGFDLYWPGVPVLLLLYLTTHGLNFFFIAMIGLAAFWVEEVLGLYLFLDRAKWILGGMLIPLASYPEGMRRALEWLPFPYMVGGPANLFVKFSWAGAWDLFWHQAVWLLALGLLCQIIYQLGVRRVDLNGG